jgi:AbrB family looped-hinge helix DNA binding protein
MVTTIDKFGRVIIPKRFRERLGISFGTTLNISENGKQIVIEPVRDNNPVVDKDGILVFTGKLDSKRNDFVHNARNKRIHKLLTNDD